MSDVQISPKNAVALVTGANRGIGKAIVEALLDAGAQKVYAGARNTESLRSLSEKYGEKLVPLCIDVTDAVSIAEAAEVAQDVQILVNNAGVLESGGFFDDNFEESATANFNVNFWGLVRVTRAFIEQLKSQPAAAIVNVSSVVGFASMPVGATYSASKAAVLNLTQGMRGELHSSNILVSAVYPGPIDTDMTKGYPIDKASPSDVAQEILTGLEEGKEDVFPDPMSKQVELGMKADAKAVEKQFAQMTKEAMQAQV